MNKKEVLEIPLSELGLDNPLPDTITYNAGIVETVMIPLLEMDNDGTGKPIEIILDTVGGSLFDGAALCNIIDNLKTPTTITVMTYAY